MSSKDLKWGRDKKYDCPCGSGRTWKHCCKENIDQKFLAYPRISIKRRNSLFLQEITEILGLQKTKVINNRVWESIKEKFSPHHVREIYKAYFRYWSDLSAEDLLEIMPNSEDSLRSVFTGTTKFKIGEIQKDILRSSLYNDEIIVFSPFVGVWNIRPEYNPIEQPHQYLQQTFESVFYIIYLKDWIEADIVHFMPKITDLDISLSSETAKLAEQRFEDNPVLKKELEEWCSKTDKEEFFDSVSRLPEEAIKSMIMGSEKNLSLVEIENMVKLIKQEGKKHPHILQNDSLMTGGEIKVFHGGGNLETALIMANASNSYLSTNNPLRWKEIKSLQREEDTFWLPVSEAIKSLDFKFLNNIPTEFAIEIRNKKRLSGMRSFLRKLKKQIPKEDTSQMEIQSLKDELIDSYERAKVDWNEIDIDLLKWEIGILGGGASALLSGTINPLIPVIGTATAGISKLIESRFKRYKFRKNNPMSIFIDLKNR